MEIKNILNEALGNLNAIKHPVLRAAIKAIFQSGWLNKGITPNSKVSNDMIMPMGRIIETLNKEQSINGHIAGFAIIPEGFDYCGVVLFSFDKPTKFSSTSRCLLLIDKKGNQTPSFWSYGNAKYTSKTLLHALKQIAEDKKKVSWENEKATVVFIYIDKEYQLKRDARRERDIIGVTDKYNYLANKNRYSTETPFMKDAKIKADHMKAVKAVGGLVKLDYKDKQIYSKLLKIKKEYDKMEYATGIPFEVNGKSFNFIEKISDNNKKVYMMPNGEPVVIMARLMKERFRPANEDWALILTADGFKLVPYSSVD